MLRKLKLFFLYINTNYYKSMEIEESIYVNNNIIEGFVKNLEFFFEEEIKIKFIKNNLPKKSVFDIIKNNNEIYFIEIKYLEGLISILKILEDSIKDNNINKKQHIKNQKIMKKIYEKNKLEEKEFIENSENIEENNFIKKNEDLEEKKEKKIILDNSFIEEFIEEKQNILENKNLEEEKHIKKNKILLENELVEEKSFEKKEEYKKNLKDIFINILTIIVYKKWGNTLLQNESHLEQLKILLKNCFNSNNINIINSFLKYIKDDISSIIRNDFTSKLITNKLTKLNNIVAGTIEKNNSIVLDILFEAFYTTILNLQSIQYIKNIIDIAMNYKDSNLLDFLKKILISTEFRNNNRFFINASNNNMSNLFNMIDILYKEKRIRKHTSSIVPELLDKNIKKILNILLIGLNQNNQHFDNKETLSIFKTIANENIFDNLLIINIGIFNRYHYNSNSLMLKSLNNILLLIGTKGRQYHELIENILKLYPFLIDRKSYQIEQELKMKFLIGRKYININQNKKITIKEQKISEEYNQVFQSLTKQEMKKLCRL